MRSRRSMACLLVAAGALAGCSSIAVPSPVASSPMAGDPTPPPTGDVVTYRGDAARTGVMPGPGPGPGAAVAWKFQAGGPIESSPLIIGSTVVLASKDGVVHGIDLATGVQRWSTTLHAAVASSSPVFVDGLLVVGDLGGTVHALDPATGAERWATSVDGAIDGAAAAIGHFVVTATEGARAYAIDARTGAIKWTSTLPAAVTRSVTASTDTVYVGAGGVLLALRLSDGTIRWQSTGSTGSTASSGTPTVAAGLVFDAIWPDGGSTPGSVVALDTATGAARWQYTSPAGRAAYTPAVSDGRAYIVSEDATVIALDAATGSSIWSTSTGAPNEALPALADGLVYVATDGGELVALEAGTGQTTWHVSIVGTPYAPVVAGGFALVATSTGNLFAIHGSAN